MRQYGLKHTWSSGGQYEASGNVRQHPNASGDIHTRKSSSQEAAGLAIKLVSGTNAALDTYKVNTGNKYIMKSRIIQSQVSTNSSWPAYIITNITLLQFNIKLRMGYNLQGG